MNRLALAVAVSLWTGTIAGYLIAPRTVRGEIQVPAEPLRATLLHFLGPEIPLKENH
jgi:hypothetical protein